MAFFGAVLESERKFSKDPGLAWVGIALKKGETFSLLIKPPTLGEKKTLNESECLRTEREGHE